MKKTLTVAVTTVALVLVGSCGVSASSNIQPFSGRVLEHYKAPGTYEEVTLYCKGGDLFIYLNGNKAGSLQMIPKEPRCG